MINAGLIRVHTQTTWTDRGIFSPPECGLIITEPLLSRLTDTVGGLGEEQVGGWCVPDILQRLGDEVAKSCGFLWFP